jgi:hypothetical protein
MNSSLAQGGMALARPVAAAATATTATTTPRSSGARRRRPRARVRPRASAPSDDGPPPRPPSALRTPRPIPNAPLGRTGLQVPRVCLGTMLFGESGPTADFAGAARLMSACAERGAAFFDSAEMYPVPPSRETAGRSEEYLGRWAKGYGR